MNEAVIVQAVRTPFGKRGGVWADTRPDDLLASAVTGLLRRAGLPGERVDDLIAGCVSQVGEQAPTSAAWPPCWPDCQRRCRACR